jgi:hypothetical protein
MRFQSPVNPILGMGSILPSAYPTRTLPQRRMNEKDTHHPPYSASHPRAQVVLSLSLSCSVAVRRGGGRAYRGRCRIPSCWACAEEGENAYSQKASSGDPNLALNIEISGYPETECGRSCPEPEYIASPGSKPARPSVSRGKIVCVKWRRGLRERLMGPKKGIASTKSVRVVDGIMHSRWRWT